MHDEIRKFYLEGIMLDANVVETRERLVRHLESMMRDYGYVPSVDNEEQFTLDWDGEQNQFKFKLTVYGVMVGKERAWELSGMTSGKEIPRYTPLPKSSQSHITVE